MDVKAVIFDADGVLLTSGFFSEELERSYGLPTSATLPFFTSALEPCLVGQADLKQELAPFLKQWSWPGSVDDFIERWFSHGASVDPRIVATIAELRRRGLRCYLATNQEPYRMAYIREQMGFEQIFDDFFFSGGIGCKKTDSRFYQVVMQATDLRGAEILFWDDTFENIVAAREQGWHAEHYRSFEEFEQTLATYLQNA
ncbi:MAG: HAD-IA family hydrolase [Chloroflexi bacterium]|nr:HAD-IA family hydrolase [Chloroflexota bacterium]